MDKLGFIPNPEQYAPAGDEVIFDNSIDALEFFQDFYGGIGGFFVLLLQNILYPHSRPLSGFFFT